MESTKIKSIFLGQVRRKTFFWDVFNDQKPIAESSEFIKYEKVYECELDRPPLEEKERIYIPELDVTLQVQNVIKSVDGSIAYQTDYTIKTIEDEKTKESYQKAVNQLEESKKVKEEIKTKQKEAKDKFDELSSYLDSRNGIARCIWTNKSNSIFVHYNDGIIELIDTDSKTSIKLDEYTQKNLINFIEFVKK